MRFRTPDVLVGIGGAGKSVTYTLFAEDNETVEEPSDLREWMIEEVMDPDAEDHLNEKLETFIVDTDVDERANDISTIGDIEDRIDEKRDEYDRAVTGPELSYINIAERGLTTAGELTNSSNVRDIARETGLSCWWLDADDPTMVDPYDDFGGGVIRRRAISKALFFSSQLETDDPIDELLDGIDDGDDVAIVVGLGGGSGSGTFLDLARIINRTKRRASISLFAIPPRLDEGDDTGANAMAALSELEYLSITEQNPFENILLFPYVDGAGENEFDEAIAQGLLSYYQLKIEGNMAAILDETQGGRGPPRFAPFTIAAPQVVRFEGAGITKSRENFREYYAQRHRVLDVEEQLYERAEAFIEEQYPEVHEAFRSPRTAPSNFSLSEGEVANLHERVAAIEELVNLGVLENVGADLAETLAERLENAEEDALGMEDVAEDAPREEKRRAVVSRVPDRFEDMEEFGPDGAMDRKENGMLGELFRRSMRAVRTRRDLLRAKNMIETGDRGADVERFEVRETEHVAEGLDVALDGTITRETTDAIDDNVATFGRRERELEALRDDLEIAREAAASVMTDELDGWHDDVEDDVEELANLYEYRDDIEDLLDDLQGAVEAAVNAAHRASKPGQISYEPVGFDRFDELEEKLAACGLDPIDEDDVATAVDAMRSARELWLESQPGGLVDRTKRWFVGAGDVEDLKHDYFDEWKTVSDLESSVVYVPQWDERPNKAARVKDGEFGARKNTLANREQRLLDAVESALAARVEDPDWTVEAAVDAEAERSLSDPDHLDEVDEFGTDLAEFDVGEALAGLVGPDADVEDALDRLTASGGEEAADGGAEPGAVSRAFERAFTAKIDHELSIAASDLEQLRSAKGTYEAAEDVVETGQEYARTTGGGLDPGDIPEVADATRERGTHIERLTPKDPAKLLEKGEIGETDLWEDDLERSRLDKSLNAFANRVVESDYLPLHEFAFDAPGHPDSEAAKYDRHRALITFMSRAFDDQLVDGEEAVVDQVQSTLEEKRSFEGSCDTMKWRRARVGNPWDITMTIFVGGVMLDNLDLFYKGGEGYREKYDRLDEESRSSTGDDRTSILVRHTHGLDGLDRGRAADHQLFDDDHDGAYLYRDEFLNLNDEDDVVTILDNLRNSTELIGELLDRYEIVPINSSVDLAEEEATSD